MIGSQNYPPIVRHKTGLRRPPHKSDVVMPYAGSACLRPPLLRNVQVSPVQPHILCVVAPVQVLAPLGVVMHAVEMIEVCQLLSQLPVAINLGATAQS